MAKNKGGNTAYGAAAVRLTEQYIPLNQKLFDDDTLRYLLPVLLRFLVRFKLIRSILKKMCNSKVDGIFGSLLCRVKFIDDKTYDAIKNNIQQVLILGAGLDTRAYRIAGIERTQVFEVDLPEVQKVKIKKLQACPKQLPPNVIYISTDFNSEPVSDVLKIARFSSFKTTLVIWEGVTQYLTKEAAEKIFQFVSTLAPGSCIAFTYVPENVINKTSGIPGAKEQIDFFEKGRSPWLFGIDPKNLELYLQQYNLQLIEQADAGYYQAKYLQPLGRQLQVSELEYAVFAKVTADNKRVV